MKACGLTPSRIRAGRANLFQSAVFREMLASTLGVSVELVNTDGAAGAARAAGLGAGIYASTAEAFRSLEIISITEPDYAAKHRLRRRRRALVHRTFQLTQILIHHDCTTQILHRRQRILSRHWPDFVQKAPKAKIRSPSATTSPIGPLWAGRWVNFFASPSPTGTALAAADRIHSASPPARCHG